MSGGVPVETRTALRRPLMLKARRSVGTTALGWTRDVSNGGLSLDCEAPVRLGQNLSLRLSFPSLLHSVPVATNVAWIGPSDEHGRRGCGLQVSGARDRERLERLVSVGESIESALGRPDFRVLVAEPEAAHVEVLSAELSESIRSMMDVWSVRDLASARQLRAECRYDMVIIDAGLCDAAGTPVLKELVSSAEGRYAGSVVAIVGGDEEFSRAERWGVDAVLHRPIDLGSWLETTGHLLCRRQQLQKRMADLRSSS